MRRATLPLVLVALLAVVLALPAVASPQPTPVCGPCGGGLEHAARGTGVDEFDVVASTAVVRIHGDGGATWHVTNHVGDETAAYLREHPSVLDRLVHESLEYTAIDTDFRNVTTSLDDRTIAVTYEDPHAARRMHGDVLVNEYFHSRGYDDLSVVTADRVTVVGPPGTTITNDPAGADVDGRNATWRGDASVRLSGAPRVADDAYVAYGDGSVGSRLWTRLDLGLRTAPIVWDVASFFFLPPLVLFALLLAFVVAGGGGLSAVETRVGRVSGAVAGLGAALVVGSLVSDVGVPLGGTRWVAGLGVVYLSLGGVAYWRGDEASPRDLLAAGLLAVVAAALTLSLLRPGGLATRSTPVRVALAEAARLFPFVVAPLVGAAAGRDSRRDVVLAGSAMLGAFLLVLLSVVWPTQRPFGAVVIVFFGAAIAVAIAVVPPFVLGAATARTEEPEGQRGVDVEAGAD